MFLITKDHIESLVRIFFYEEAQNLSYPFSERKKERTLSRGSTKFKIVFW
jgi:hypothetical protein